MAIANSHKNKNNIVILHIVTPGSNVTRTKKVVAEGVSELKPRDAFMLGQKALKLSASGCELIRRVC